MSGSHRLANHPTSGAQRMRGFTLVELLIVAVVLAVLAAIVVPTLGNATAPLPRPLADLIEHDLRRARIESIGQVREMLVVVGRERDRWWIQTADAAGAQGALPNSVRILGRGTLAPFEGLALELRVDGATPPSADALIAAYTAQGVRDNRTVDVTLVHQAADEPVARWRIAPQRSRLQDIELSTGSSSMGSGSTR